MLDNGADPEACDENANKALHLAAGKGHLAVVQCLLDNGADIEASGMCDAKPLWYAARGGHLAVVQCLLENGANIEAKNKEGETPLYYAVRHPDILKYLLLHKAKICERSFKKMKEQFTDWQKKLSKTLLNRVKDSIKNLMNLDTVLKDWKGYAPVYRLDILSQACVETGNVVQAIEFQKEIFYHKDSTKTEQSNAANHIAMSYLNLKSIDETDRYIKSLEYAVFDDQALEVVMAYFKEQINNKNFDAIDKIYDYYRDNEINDNSKLKFLEVFCELSRKSKAMKAEQDNKPNSVKR